MEVTLDMAIAALGLPRNSASIMHLDCLGHSYCTFNHADS